MDSCSKITENSEVRIQTNCIFCLSEIIKIKSEDPESEDGSFENVTTWAHLLGLSSNTYDQLEKLFDTNSYLTNEELCCFKCQVLITRGGIIFKKIQRLEMDLEEIKREFRGLIDGSVNERVEEESELAEERKKARKIILKDLGHFNYFKNLEKIGIFGLNNKSSIDDDADESDSNSNSTIYDFPMGNDNLDNSPATPGTPAENENSFDDDDEKTPAFPADDIKIEDTPDKSYPEENTRTTRSGRQIQPNKNITKSKISKEKTKITKNKSKKLTPKIKPSEKSQKLTESKNDLKGQKDQGQKTRKNKKCDVCDKSFTLIKDLLAHKYNFHDGPKCFKCSEKGCGETFGTIVQLEYHKDEHRDKVACPECGKEFGPTTMKSHMRTHPVKAFKCSFEGCKSTFKYRYALKHHEDIHKSKESVQSSKYICQSCGKEYPTEYTLKRHAKTHSEDFLEKKTKKDFKCNFKGCDFKTHLNCLLKYYERTHSKDYCFICEDCGKKFNSNVNLKKHKFQTHGKKKFFCGKCDKSFILKNDLQMHQNTHLAKENQPFKCSFSTKCFARSDTLRAHESLHEGPRDFECDLCSKAFTCHKNLYAHKYRVHKIKK